MFYLISHHAYKDIAYLEQLGLLKNNKANMCCTVGEPKSLKKY